MPSEDFLEVVEAHLLEHLDANSQKYSAQVS